MHSIINATENTVSKLSKIYSISFGISSYSIAKIIIFPIINIIIQTSKIELFKILYIFFLSSFPGT